MRDSSVGFKVRPLAVTPELREDEWLQTAISRWAFSVFHCTRQDLFRYLQLDRYPPKALGTLGARPTEELVSSLALATGIPAERLNEATLHGLDGKAIRFAADSDTILTSAGWVRRTGSRYCTECLREHPGVFLRRWRLTWAFVCTRHGRILEDVCPGCNKPPTDVTGSTREMWNPNTCRNNLSGLSGNRVCGTDLTIDRECMPVPIDSPISAAQKFIDRTIDEDPDAMNVLRTLGGVVSALRAIGDVDAVCSLAAVETSGVLGLIEPELRVGSSAPKDAYALAVLTTAAVRVMTDPEALVGPFIRDITFSRAPNLVPRGAGMSVGSIRELLALWGHPDAHMQGRILRALDADLPTAARIRYASPLPPIVRPRLKSSLGTAPMTTESLPRLIWPEWAIPLHVDEGSTLEATRHAFSRAISDEESSEIRPTMLGGDESKERIIMSLALLGQDLRTYQMPINYGRRRRLLRWSKLLTDDQWRRACDAAGAAPGAGRRVILARRYLYLRATGDRHSDLPVGMAKTPHARDAAELTAFVLGMTAELQAVLDGYLRAFLNAFDDDMDRLMFKQGMNEPTPFSREPLMWSPPRAPEQLCLAVGRELDDIDADRLHEMIRAGVTSLSQLGAAVSRSDSHVRLFLERHPAPSGRPLLLPDWSLDFSRGFPRERETYIDNEEEWARLAAAWHRRPVPTAEPHLLHVEHAERLQRLTERALRL